MFKSHISDRPKLRQLSADLFEQDATERLSEKLTVLQHSSCTYFVFSRTKAEICLECICIVFGMEMGGNLSFMTDVCAYACASRASMMHVI